MAFKKKDNLLRLSYTFERLTKGAWVLQRFNLGSQVIPNAFGLRVTELSQLLPCTGRNLNPPNQVPAPLQSGCRCTPLRFVFE